MQETLSKILKHPAFEELFYVISQGREKRYKEYGKELDFARLLDGRTDCFYTYIIEDDALNLKKKSILLCDFSASFLLNEAEILKSLLAMGFSVFVLVSGNKLQEISTQDVQNTDYLKTWLPQYQFFRRPTVIGQQSNRLKLALKAAGQQDMESWNILDHYMWQRLLHAVKMVLSANSEFEYSFSPVEKTPLQDALGINPDFDEGYFKQLLDYIPQAEVALFDVGTIIKPSYLQNFVRLKGLQVAGGHPDFRKLIEYPGIQRLYIYGCYLSNLPEKLPKNTWSLKAFANTSNLPELPPTLDDLAVYQIKSHFKWPKKWPLALRKMHLSLDFEMLELLFLPEGLIFLALDYPGKFPNLSNVFRELEELDLRSEQDFPQALTTENFPKLQRLILHHREHCGQFDPDEVSRQAGLKLPQELPLGVKQVLIMNCCPLDIKTLRSLLKKYQPQVLFLLQQRHIKEFFFTGKTGNTNTKSKKTKFASHVDAGDRMPSLASSYMPMGAGPSFPLGDDDEIPSLPDIFFEPPRERKKEGKDSLAPLSSSDHSRSKDPISTQVDPFPRVEITHTIFKIVNLGRTSRLGQRVLLLPEDHRGYRRTVEVQLHVRKNASGADLLEVLPGKRQLIPVPMVDKFQQPRRSWSAGPVFRLKESFTCPDDFSEYRGEDCYFNEESWGQGKAGDEEGWPLSTLWSKDQVLCIYTTPGIPVELFYDVINEQYILQRPYNPDTDSWPLQLQYVFNTANTKEISMPLMPALPDELRDQFEILMAETTSLDGADPGFKSLCAEMRLIAARRGKVEIQELNRFVQTRLIPFFQTFTLPPSQLGFLNLLYLKFGNCAVRSTLCIWLCQSLDIPSRVEGNEMHAIMSIYDGKQFYLSDLGGTPGEIDDSRLQKPFQLEPSQPIWKSYFLPPKEKEYKHISLDSVLHELAKPKKILLAIETTEQGRSFYPALQAILQKKSIIYIETAEQLASLWRHCFVLPNGEPAKIAGKLRKQLKFGEESWVIINFGGFTPAQMASTMSINDELRIFKGVAIPDHVHVINLLPEKMKEVVGPRFLSRVPEYFWPPHIPMPTALPEDLSLRMADSLAGDLLEVNLYRGEVFDWQKLLLGYYSLGQGKFNYNKGLLQKILENGASGFRLIKPPLRDPAFKLFLFILHYQRWFIADGCEFTLAKHFQIILADQELPRSDASLLRPTAGAAKDQPSLFSEPADKKESGHRLKRKRAEDEELTSAGPAEKKGKVQADATASVFDTVECFIHRGNFLSLFEEDIVRDGGQEQVIDWLLQRETGSHKLLVLTEALLPEQRDYLAMKLVNSPVEVTIHDLTEQPLKSQEITSCMQATALASSGLIETSDPWFVVRQLASLTTDPLLIPIHARTEADKLLDLPKPDLKERSIAIETGLIAEGLRKGQTVFLYGSELSKEMYQALEPLFSDKPLLPSVTSAAPMPVPGRLIVVTSRVEITPRLAQWKNCHLSLPGQLWADYAQQLEKEYSAEDYPHYPDAFEKIQNFYHLVAKIKHGRSGMPPVPHLTYIRLKLMLQSLTQGDDDNMFKAFFPHDYDHDSEAYAYLVVLIKLFFFPANPKADAKEPKLGVRRAKLDAYPEDSFHFWRRLNCLDAHALRVLFASYKGEPLFEMPRTVLKIEDFIEELVSYDIPKQKDPQAKLLRRLVQILAKHSMVALIGEPGSGKTYIAELYAAMPGHKRFWGEEEILLWLQDRTDMEKVLIIDEANLSAAGYWDFLMPLLDPLHPEIVWQGKRYPITKHHKVIFTGNPTASSSYAAARVFQPVMQDMPQIYVKTWTRGTLEERIMLPRLLSLSSTYPKDSKETASYVSDARPEIVENLLDAVQIVNTLLAHSELMPGASLYYFKEAPLVTKEVTIRDLKQLLCRVCLQPSAISDKAAWQRAAYEACVVEWSRRFSERHSRELFEEQMALLFRQERKSIKDFVSMQPYAKILQEIGKKYYLCAEQEAWILTICQNMDMAKDPRFIHYLDKTPGVKQGVLLEGGSGLGKTTLLVELAKAMRLRNLPPEELTPDASRDLSGYYSQFTPDEDIAQNEAWLLQLYNGGCKAILDEFNLTTALEGLLNQLLTGKTPGGRGPIYPDFYLLASQNSSLHAGSKASSAALKNRMHLLFTELFIEDLTEVAERALLPLVTHKGTRKKLAADILMSYTTAQASNPLAVNTRSFFEGLKKIVAELTLTMRSSATAMTTVSAPGYGSKFSLSSSSVSSSLPSVASDFADGLGMATL